MSQEATELPVTVRAIMRYAHVTTTPEESVGRALQKMHLFDTSHLVVVRGADVLGLVTERALLRSRASARTPAHVGDVMSRAIAVVSPMTDAGEASRLFDEQRLDALAVVHRGEVIGVVVPARVVKRPVRRERGAPVR